VGITSPGSLTDNTLRYFITQMKLDPDTDFQLVGAGTGGTMRAAIQSGAVAAGMLTTPDVQSALGADGKFKLVDDFRKLQYPALDLLVMQTWVTAHPETARAFAAAVVHAEHLIQTDPKAVEAGLLEMFPKLDPALRTVLAEEAPKLLSPDGVMGKPGYDLMVKMLQVSDPTMSAVPYSTVTDLAILPKS
jgi:NitT/TauT family transport system substrate-binding protein